MYVKVESERLRFIALSQTKLRAENYIHLQDAIRNDADLDQNQMGNGSNGNQIESNAWPEITRELIPGKNSTDRHDLTSRVFKVIVQKLVDLLTKGKIFDDMKCFKYLIEWQIRCLPHVHLLMWLLEKLRPNKVYEILSVEIPNPETELKLYDTVTKNMSHSPGGALNPSSRCMEEGKCTKSIQGGF
ncbi:helitron_like_N domain-containing protein [Trichonephila clavipes]|nr:helitron_like_N domain-containing protein [Trichonephila clavipes]